MYASRACAQPQHCAVYGRGRRWNAEEAESSTTASSSLRAWQFPVSCCYATAVFAVYVSLVDDANVTVSYGSSVSSTTIDSSNDTVVVK